MRKDKQKALKLRREGKSYGEINKKLGVAKSTLSAWLKDVRFSKNVRDRNVLKGKIVAAKNITAYNKRRSRLIHDRWSKEQRLASQEIGKLSRRELKLIGISLYWAEGYKKTKWSVMFCNSDPEMVKLMMRFFREVCRVSESKFRPQVQIHRNVSAGTAVAYWSKVVKLPSKNFNKTLFQAPRSSKSKRPGGSLPHGVMRIQINDVTLVNKVKGWIKGLAKA